MAKSKIRKPVKQETKSTALLWLPSTNIGEAFAHYKLGTIYRAGGKRKSFGLYKFYCVLSDGKTFFTKDLKEAKKRISEYSKRKQLETGSKPQTKNHQIKRK